MKLRCSAAALALAVFSSAAFAQTGVPASCPRADGAFIACTPVVVVDPTTKQPVPANTDPSTGAKQTTNTTAIQTLQAAVVAALGTPAQATTAATSTPSTGTVTSSAVSSTSGTGATFASGTATIPFTPQIGLAIRLTLSGGASISASMGTSLNSCSTITPLTAGGQPISYSGSVDEYVDVPVTTATTAGIKYCLQLTVAGGGTETYGLRQ